MTPETHSQLAAFIWSICNLLRGPYKRNEYRKVILPLTVLRRFDCVLAPTKAKVVKRHEQLKAGKVRNFDAVLNKVAGDGKDLGFHNHSPLDYVL